MTQCEMMVHLPIPAAEAHNDGMGCIGENTSIKIYCRGVARNIERGFLNVCARAIFLVK